MTDVVHGFASEIKHSIHKCHSKYVQNFKRLKSSTEIAAEPVFSETNRICMTKKKLKIYMKRQIILN